MRKSKNYDENDFLARMLFLFHSLLHIATGLYLVLKDNVEYESPTYITMSNLISLGAWGSVFILTGILYILASFQEGRSKQWYMIVSGLLGAFIFGLYAMASAELADNIMIAARYGIIASFNAIIALVGVYSLWNRRN